MSGLLPPPNYQLEGAAIWLKLAAIRILRILGIIHPNIILRETSFFSANRHPVGQFDTQ